MDRSKAAKMESSRKGNLKLEFENETHTFCFGAACHGCSGIPTESAATDVHTQELLQPRSILPHQPAPAAASGKLDPRAWTRPVTRLLLDCVRDGTRPARMFQEGEQQNERALHVQARG